MPIHILSNAVKYTSVGEVHVELIPERCRDGVIIRISDTGCGIVPELWRVNLSETPATIRMRFYVAASVTLSS